MTTPDGWQVELMRFDEEPMFRVTCDDPARARPQPGNGVLVSLPQLVSILGESFELLTPAGDRTDHHAATVV